MLISFDLYGKHQVKKYLSLMNNYNLQLEAGPDALLDKAHDNYYIIKLWEFFILI